MKNEGTFVNKQKESKEVSGPTYASLSEKEHAH